MRDNIILCTNIKTKLKVPESIKNLWWKFSFNDFSFLSLSFELSLLLLLTDEIVLLDDVMCFRLPKGLALLISVLFDSRAGLPAVKIDSPGMQKNFLS